MATKTATEDMPDLPEILPFDGDAYHGVQIDVAALFESETETEKTEIDPAAFGRRLRSSLEHWRAAGRRGVWLKLPLPRASALFSVAVDEGFEPHHAEKDYVMMTQWLPGPPPSSSSATAATTAAAEAPEEENKTKNNNNRFSKLPSYASHQVGVGAFVLNSRNEVLVVQEASGPLRGKGVWKMPTGLADAGEDVPRAAAREVLEETGLRAEATAVLAVRQAHGFAFGRSDLFFVVALRPEGGDEGEAAQPAALDSSLLVPQEDEVCAARWMPLDEYCSMPWLASRPLWSQVARACEAHARGMYAGMPLRWLDNGHNGRSDLLMLGWGEEEKEEEEKKE